MQKFTGKMRGPHFVRACAIEMHFNIAQARAASYGNFRKFRGKLLLCGEVKSSLGAYPGLSETSYT